ncbi:NEL-type E3 ubiquitin ligase domain-containing protein [Pseudomonas sp. NPDC087615]|uniref:NEL-type E3 ubiquitin ligase domain-containing protein n=1 Tax=Pseudomonas sp. NPDC087615 TaxID=3364443 RepID=UPI003810DE1C
MSPIPESAENAEKGRHYEFIKSAVSDSFKGATVARGQALAAVPLKIEPWYLKAPDTWLEKLAAANLKAWASQNPVDHLMAKTDLHAFAEPLLKAAIKRRHGLELDVKKTYLRLYMPKDQPWYTIKLSGGVTSRTVSLLDAALHNFAKSETVDRGSEYISQPDERGLFDVLPIRHSMSIAQFQTLCRDLDIGAHYEKHLHRYLLPGEPVAEAVLKNRVIQSQQDALTAAAYMALIKNDIQVDTCTMLLNLAEDKPQLLLNGRAMLCCDLSILSTRLTGILLLIDAVRDSRGIRRVIAYVPHDPDHPLKEYDSLKAFKDELTRQLRENKYIESTKQTYRQFFSDFVDQQQRGHFFAELEQRLFIYRYHPRQDPTDQRPPWRQDPVDNPNLQFDRVQLQGNYWRHLYQQKFNKILNDARELAVSTADTDSKARWAWWENFQKMLSDILNVALLVVTPFVPVLGQLMLAYTAYQLATDVIEGIVDLAQGQSLEAGEHLISVVTDVIQLAAFASGAKIGEVVRVKLSSLVDDMKPVKLPNGKPSLWHPDIKPYERNDINLAPDAKPDKHGLHLYGDERVLLLERKLYAVEKASSEPTSKTHRIKHPTRPNAYKPLIEHNGHGAWVQEIENPRDWDFATLMRRVGHSVEGFSPVQREQIRVISGTHENQLRQMHIDNTAPPPLLTDTIKRFSAYDDARVASANIRNGRPIDPQAVWFEPLLTRQPGWPRTKALKIYESADLQGYARTYGDANAADADTLSISLADLTSGKLPERLANFLDDTEFKQLLGRDVPRSDRATAVRNLLADAVDTRQKDVSNYLYQVGEKSNKADIRAVQKTFPQLPLPLAEKVVALAKPAELQRIADENHLPLRLKAQARELDFEASTARAYNGFFQEQWMLPETERLALNTLKFNTDTFADVRLDVHDGSYDGPLRCSVGADDATTVRRLVRDEHGRYEVLDANNRTLHEADDFYESILHALPDEKLQATGYRRGQGQRLKQWLLETSAEPAERRSVMAEPPIRRVASVETETLTGRWPWPWAQNTPEQKVRKLYPKMSEHQAKVFIEKLRKNGDPTDAIKHLEGEREQLRTEMQNWRESYPPDVDGSGEPIPGVSTQYMQEGGRHIEERLLECFERQNDTYAEHSNPQEQGYSLDLSSSLSRPNLDRWWGDLRKRPGMKRHLDQITALKLDKTRFSTSSDGVLGSFPKLRELSARQCDLTEIPPTLGEMRHLQSLDLTDNRIKLTVRSNEQLGGLIRLRSLNLNGNPLRQPPDVGRMYRLKDLSLANTDIQSWPEGLFKVGSVDKHRPRGFMLDMRHTPINTLPEVTPGSDQAFILSRARFDTAKLSNEARVRYGTYRQSTGMAFVQTDFPAATNELSHWKSFPGEPDGFGPSASLSKYREESWHDLMAEPGSADFFAVIARQRRTADYQNTQTRQQLTQRVWEMIDAAALDSDLREELFKQAREPDSCRDGGAYLFNSMGIKVLVSRAYAEPASALALDHNLARLARSRARLNIVGDIAREEIGRQEQQHLIDPSNNRAPDDLEIHMAYETGLAERLELPWQSKGMLYQQRSGVTQAKIDAAYDSFKLRESGNGLVDGMIDPNGDDFWERHLRKTHPTQYERNDLRFEEKPGLLDELRLAQAEYANANAQTQMNPLIRKMETLADQLNIPHADIFSGEAMSQARYDRLLNNIGYSRNELSRQLTREALISIGH